MRIPIKYIFVAAGVFILAVWGLVYQWRNPRTVTVPDYRPAPVDSLTWVRRARYERRGTIIDSLDRVDRALGSRVRKGRNQIAAYVAIEGRLRTRLDSMATDSARPVTRRIRGCIGDTTLTWSRTFGDRLFRSTSTVRIRKDSISNTLSLQQLRPVRIRVANTVTPDNSAVLTYVNSPDFSSLQYRSSTSLKRRRNISGFLLGSAVTLGVLAALKVAGL